MTQIATVEKILPGGMAEISVPRKSACGHDCEECAGCGVSGASVRAAYELVNRDAIMRAAARDMEERLVRSILSGADRPREGGLTSQSAAVVKSDVAGMSRSARREIIRRVQRGEKISF